MHAHVCTHVPCPLPIAPQVSAIFGASLEVMISVFAEQPWGGAGGEPSVFHCADAFATLCVVDLQVRTRGVAPAHAPCVMCAGGGASGCVARHAKTAASFAACALLASGPAAAYPLPAGASHAGRQAAIPGAARRVHCAVLSSECM